MPGTFVSAVAIYDRDDTTLTISISAQEAFIFVTTVKSHLSMIDRPMMRDQGASLHHVLYKARQSVANGSANGFKPSPPDAQSKLPSVGQSAASAMASPMAASLTSNAPLNVAPNASLNVAPSVASGPGIVSRRDLAIMVDELCAGTTFVNSDLDKNFHAIFASCTHSEVPALSPRSWQTLPR